MVALFVLLTFILFIVIDLFVLKAQKKTHPAFAIPMQATDVSVFTKNTISVPKGIYFSKGHTWAQEDAPGMVKVGVDDFILKALGSFKFQQTVAPGSKIRKGEIIFEGGNQNSLFKFRSPVDGTVSKVNTSIIGSDIKEPYEKNWSLIIDSPNFSETKNSLYSGKELTDWMKKEFNRFKEFLNNHTLKPELAGMTMQDGGNVVEGVITSIDAKGIKDFEKEFLTF